MFPLKERIYNPYEFIQYIQADNFREKMDVRYVIQGEATWEIHVSGKEALLKKRNDFNSSFIFC